MKKAFKIIGLISLTCFSFFVTEKTATVVSDMDEIMLKINEQKENYRLDAIDAIIDGDTIIPGISAREVNVNKSYKNMKKSGYFNDKLFVYNYEKPKISLMDNVDKFIIKGNPNKKMVSLIFVIENSEDITDILKIINNYNIKSTFFVNYNWFSNNAVLVENLISEGHVVEPFMDDYGQSEYEWMDIILKKINKQKIGFCYNINNNKQNLEECKLRNNYTINPIVISEKTPLVDIKQKLESGALLSLKINSQVKKELSTIIIHIKSKGYKLVNLIDNVME